MTTLTLGYIPGISENLSVSASSFNQHLLITGKSGSGKTVALKKIEEGLAQQGGRVLVLNYSRTHDSLSETPGVRYINARADGIPLSLFTPLIRPDGSEEAMDDICEAAVDTLSIVEKLGHLQRRVSAKACCMAITNRKTCEDDMKCLYDALAECKEEAAEKIIDKFGGPFWKTKFWANGKLWDDRRITVLDFSEYNISAQILLSEVVLSVLWRQHRGQQETEPVWVACDEFQSLHLRETSVLTQILREGRKFNLSLLLATQTLSTFRTENRTLLQQAGTKLYFRPPEKDITSLSKDMPGIPRWKAQQMLCGLGIGECLAVGEFVIGACSAERIFKMSFR